MIYHPFIRLLLFISYCVWLQLNRNCPMNKVQGHFYQFKHVSECSWSPIRVSQEEEMENQTLPK
jgi:hypothetical protein